MYTRKLKNYKAPQVSRDKHMFVSKDLSKLTPVTVHSNHIGESSNIVYIDIVVSHKITPTSFPFCFFSISKDH